MVTDQLAKSFAQVRGGVPTSAHVHVCTTFPNFGNGWTDCAEIWCGVRDPSVVRFTQTKSGIHLHVTCRCVMYDTSTRARVDVKRVRYVLYSN